jgi:hypothetical protein
MNPEISWTLALTSVLSPRRGCIVRRWLVMLDHSIRFKGSMRELLVGEISPR